MRVHVRRTGAGRPIVATAGIGKTGATWDALAVALDRVAASPYEVLGWDLLGHGESPVPEDPAEYTRDRALDDIDDVIASTGADPSEVVLMGHSLGGYLTMAWTATRPVAPRAMILLATGPGFRDAEKRNAWNERSRRNAHRFGVPPQAAELNLQEDGVVIENVKTMDVPTLLLVGTEDRPEIHGGSSYLAAKMPNASLVTIEGGDHLMHEGDFADPIGDAVGTFLNALPT